MIKCRLFTRKWHVVEQNLMWQNGIDRWNTIQACEKLPNVHVVQWLGVFWLDFGHCFHSTRWNVSCLACTLWEKEWKKHFLTKKLYIIIQLHLSNAAIWLVQDTYHNAANWLVWDIYPNVAIWLVWATHHSTH